MNEKDIQHMIELAEKKIRETTTPAQALQNLVDAGILDVYGHYTAPYQEMLNNEQ
jgi:predicted transcriptional regulator